MNARDSNQPPSAPAADSASNAKIAAQAAEWFMRRDAGLDAAGERALTAWRAADPRHEQAYARAAGAWAVFDRAGQAGAVDAIVTRLEIRARKRRRRRGRLAAMATSGVAIAALVAVAFLRDPSVAPDAPEVVKPAIAVGSEPVRKLPDGSIVELNHGAEIVVRYEAAARRVRLVRGEAHFRVEKDAARPFIVEASGVEVRAVGTAFTVQLQPSAIEVVVTQGTVAVEQAAPGAATTVVPARVAAGNRVVVRTAPDAPLAPRIEPLTEAEIDERLAWRIPRLQFTAMELGPAVALMNKHNRLQIVLGDAAIGRLRISGAFRSDNPEGFVRIVEESFDLRAERRSEFEVVLTAGSPHLR